MPKKSVKQLDQTIRISRNWQLAFMAAMACSFLASAGITVYFYTRSGSYINAGTWWYQASQWLMPLAYLAAGILFSWRRYALLLHRLFWGIFCATIGVVLYGAVSMGAMTIYYNIPRFQSYGTSDPGLFGAFGVEWSIMAMGFALYCVALGLVLRRKR